VLMKQACTLEFAIEEPLSDQCHYQINCQSIILLQ
jgi:hypothetical protein